MITWYLQPNPTVQADAMVTAGVEASDLDDRRPRLRPILAQIHTKETIPPNPLRIYTQIITTHLTLLVVSIVGVIFDPSNPERCDSGTSESARYTTKE